VKLAGLLAPSAFTCTQCHELPSGISFHLMAEPLSIFSQNESSPSVGAMTRAQMVKVAEASGFSKLSEVTPSVAGIEVLLSLPAMASM
jgi:hypothetical protein